MAYIYDLTDTWSAGGTAFNAIKMNVTDSASAAGSKLITLQTNGTEHFSVSKAGVGYFSGNVGIGTASPAAKLEASVTSAGATAEVLRLSNQGAGANTQAQINFFTTSTSYATIAGGYGASAPQMTFNLPSVTAGNYVWQISGTERMRIDSSGNLLVGTTSATAGYLASINGALTLGNGSSLSWGGAYNSGSPTIGGSTNFLAFYPNGATSGETMRITSAGNVGIGTSSPSAKLNVAGTAVMSRFQTGAATDGRVEFAYNTTDIGYINMASASLFDITARSGVALAFGAGGSERMRIDSSGNVGIGTSAAGAKLDVKSQINVTNASNVSFNALRGSRFGYSASYNALVVGATSGPTTVCVNVDPIGNAGGTFSGTGGEVMFRNGATFITPNSGNADYHLNVMSFKDGNVGIGTANPNAELEVNGGLDGVYNANVLISSSASSAKLAFNPNGVSSAAIGSASSSLIFYANGANAERARIDSSGNLLVGATSGSGARVSVTGAAAAGNFSSNNTSGDSTKYHFVVYENGTERGSITSNGSNTAYNTSSDVRLKENIADADDAASLIDAIQVRKFDWKDGGQHQRYGFVAQELIEVAPEAVSAPADEDAMMGVDYSKLVPMLVKEIQSLRARVAQLEGN